MSSHPAGSTRWRHSGCHWLVHGLFLCIDLPWESSPPPSHYWWCWLPQRLHCTCHVPASAPAESHPGFCERKITSKHQLGWRKAKQHAANVVWGSTQYLPPLNHVRLIVPVLPGPMSVDLSVHSGPARHGSWHVRQLGRDGGETLLQRRTVGVQGGWVGGREGGRKRREGRGWGGLIPTGQRDWGGGFAWGRGEGPPGARWDSLQRSLERGNKRLEKLNSWFIQQHQRCLSYLLSSIDNDKKERNVAMFSIVSYYIYQSCQIYSTPVLLKPSVDSENTELADERLAKANKSSNFHHYSAPSHMNGE